MEISLFKNLFNLQKNDTSYIWMKIGRDSHAMNKVLLGQTRFSKNNTELWYHVEDVYTEINVSAILTYITVSLRPNEAGEKSTL